MKRRKTTRYLLKGMLHACHPNYPRVLGRRMDTSMMRKCEAIFNKAIALSKIHEAVLFVESANGDFSYGQGYGGKDIDSPILMASITCILALREESKLSI